MLSTIKDFVMRALGLTAWHEAGSGGALYWRRWHQGRWETREMTQEEMDCALRDWAIK
ncbi:hypothetical protein [Sinorhizobium fredii]|uniref:hypothetical protein n=1 Tax=Rhizobium fredii TaxID=380 RepID=UPI0004AEFE5B|nr:hypothetical protein [Sinorhizobium fredii]